MKLNILGTEWKLSFKKEDEDFRLIECDGYADLYNKKIVIKDIKEENRNLIEYTKKIIRHELIHAFLYESGLAHGTSTVEAWAVHEEMIDWLSIQLHKIEKVAYKVYEELEHEQKG